MKCLDLLLVAACLLSLAGLLVLQGCASTYKTRLGDCKDDAALVCMLESRCQVALWDDPPHVQAFAGDAWLHSGHDGYRHFVFESRRDNPGEPLKIFGRNEYFEFYRRMR